MQSENFILLNILFSLPILKTSLIDKYYNLIRIMDKLFDQLIEETVSFKVLKQQKDNNFNQPKAIAQLEDFLYHMQDGLGQKKEIQQKEYKSSSTGFVPTPNLQHLGHIQAEDQSIPNNNTKRYIKKEDRVDINHEECDESNDSMGKDSEKNNNNGSGMFQDYPPVEKGIDHQYKELIDGKNKKKVQQHMVFQQNEEINQKKSKKQQIKQKKIEKKKKGSNIIQPMNEDGNALESQNDEQFQAPESEEPYYPDRQRKRAKSKNKLDQKPKKDIPQRDNPKRDGNHVHQNISLLIEKNLPQQKLYFQCLRQIQGMSLHRSQFNIIISFLFTSKIQNQQGIRKYLKNLKIGVMRKIQKASKNYEKKSIILKKLDEQLKILDYLILSSSKGCINLEELKQQWCATLYNGNKKQIELKLLKMKQMHQLDLNSIIQLQK